MMAQRLSRGFGAGLVGVLLAGTALADGDGEMIYKYTTADGTVVYTDKLSDLPRERRAHYNKLLEERRQEEEEAEGEDDERAAAAPADDGEAEANANKDAQIQALDERLKAYKSQQTGTDQKKNEWQKKMRDAKARLKATMATFKAKQKEWQGLATKASFTLFGSQAEQKKKLEAELKSLEAQIDGLILDVYQRIPEQARKAGVPPGWIR